MLKKIACLKCKLPWVSCIFLLAVSDDPRSGAVSSVGYRLSVLIAEDWGDFRSSFSHLLVVKPFTSWRTRMFTDEDTPLIAPEQITRDDISRYSCYVSPVPNRGHIR